jgi:hypothetical protein
MILTIVAAFGLLVIITEILLYRKRKKFNRPQGHKP